MQMTLFHADCVGSPANCSYPHKVVVDDAVKMEAVVAHDHVCATYKNDYRNVSNFIQSDVIPMDIDNDHTENPAEWLTEVQGGEGGARLQWIFIPRQERNAPCGYALGTPI